MNNICLQSVTDSLSYSYLYIFLNQITPDLRCFDTVDVISNYCSHYDSCPTVNGRIEKTSSMSLII